ncbi:hypothetical protein KQI84_13525 [bacterium]|nr:hypothetical protein [bacterium]
MNAKCLCTPEAARALCQAMGLPAADVVEAEIEFRELPYCIVSRSREQWTEARGDITALQVVAIGDRGLVLDPGSTTSDGQDSARRTLIPWTNILSLTVAPASAAAQ